MLRVLSNVYEVSVPGGRPRRVHVSSLKEHVPPLSGGQTLTFAAAPAEAAEAEAEWVVERISAHRTLPSGQLQWLVHWRGVASPAGSP